MAATVVLAILVGTISFIGGAVALVIFCRKNQKWCKAIISNADTESQTSRRDLVSARLPSLIFIEIILLLWYLMAAIPLMLFLWFYSDSAQFDMAGSIVFVSSFIPLFTTHIIRIWLLNLKYNVTSLSMLNQLGMMKWRDINHMIWTKIYYKYKWSHNIKTLMIISAVLDVVITVLYSILLSVDMQLRIYLNGFIFSTLTFILVVGVFGLKSFKDPFNIYREEIIILIVWLIALSLYAILYWILWKQFVHKVLTGGAWTIMSTFFGGSAALLSIIIHFYFNDKSIETVMNNPPQLSVIVSTKEGLEIFLKFLVTELSVENLEFFTLSMRWRHRLVLRHERMEQKKLKLHETKENIRTQSLPVVTDTGDQPKDPKNDPAAALMRVTSVKQITHNLIKATSERLLIRPKTKHNETHLKQLPFPILTFEFLDKDAGASKPRLRDQSMTEVSRVPEFSRTRITMLDGGPTLHTPVLTPQMPKHRSVRLSPRLDALSPRVAAVSVPKGFRETGISLFLDQYDFMQETRRRITEYKNNVSPPSTNACTSDTSALTEDNNKNYTMKVSSKFRPMSLPMSLGDYEAGGITPMNNDSNPLHHQTQDPYAQMPDTRPKIATQITHPESHEEDSTDLAYAPVPTSWTTPKVGNLQKILASSDHEDEDGPNDGLKPNPPKEEVKVEAVEPIAKDNYNFHDDTNEYNEDWTEEFMSSKRVDYDRFSTLSEDINISSRARKRVRKFFKIYPTVTLFCNVQIAEYDTAFEMAWKNVWQNLNDSLRRFHQSKFFQEWLQSNAAMQYNIQTQEET